MSYFNIILLITCLCLGIRAISDTGKLFEPLKDLLGKVLPMWLWMPVIGCVACMSSFWGTIVFWTIEFHIDNIINSLTIVKWIGCCFSAAFFNEMGWTVLMVLRELVNVLMKK